MLKFVKLLYACHLIFYHFLLSFSLFISNHDIVHIRINILHTGWCAVTSGSALSLASCWKSADKNGDLVTSRGGIGPLPVELCVDGHSPSEAAMTGAEVQCQQRVALLPASLNVTKICKSVGVSEKLVVKVLKLLKEGNDLKIVSSEWPQPSKGPLPI